MVTKPSVPNNGIAGFFDGSAFEIQGCKVSGLGAICQVVEHFGMHYRQILSVTQMLYGEDLGFYTKGPLLAL
jgi:hypothetical protein